MSSFTEDDLRKMGMVRNEDGSYSKSKSKPQLHELEKVAIISNGNVNLTPVQIVNHYLQTGNMIINSFEPEKYRTIKLTLFGDPMPKQSFRHFDTGKRNAKGKAVIGSYQPKEMSDRKKDYIQQIKEQLPKDFIPFSEIVFVTKMHFIFPPLKAFHKVKGKMDAIRNGEIFYKTTKPDIDNLSKMALDSIKDIVMVDDNLIVGISDMKKYYGVGGCIIIELKGK